MDDEREDGAKVEREADDLQADPNGDRFAQGGGGKVYRDGVLVEDLDAEEDDE